MLSMQPFLKKAITLPEIFKQQSRNTFILKRKWPPPLYKKGGKPEKLKGRHFVYDLVEDTNVRKQAQMSIILKQYVEGVGNCGDIIMMHPQKAYKEYLVPGLGVYTSPENIIKYKTDEAKPKEEKIFTSPHVERSMNCLSRLVLQITMSKLEPWTLEPWHIRTSFRKAGFVVPENTIRMPPVQIKGPDLTLQDKEFYVTVKINNKEEVNVRCRIHHWATGLDRLPWFENHWKVPLEPLISEQSDVLDKIPLPQ